MKRLLTIFAIFGAFSSAELQADEKNPILSQQVPVPGPAASVAASFPEAAVREAAGKVFSFASNFNSKAESAFKGDLADVDDSEDDRDVRDIAQAFNNDAKRFEKQMNQPNFFKQPDHGKYDFADFNESLGPLALYFSRNRISLLNQVCERSARENLQERVAACKWFESELKALLTPTTGAVWLLRNIYFRGYRPPPPPAPAPPPAPKTETPSGPSAPGAPAATPPWTQPAPASPK